MGEGILIKIVAWLMAALVGAVFGVAGTITHAFVIGPIPVGLILAIISSAAILVAVRLLTDDRRSTLAAGVGMMAATIAFSGVGPGGSVVVPQSILGNIWVIAVPLVATLVIAWPRLSRVRQPRRLDS